MNKILGAIFVSLSVAGCSTVETAASVKNPSRSVKATWYGIGDGSNSHTASGARFNPHGMTAAHKTLKFGTRVKVTNPKNGKSVTVLINDRGPFVKGVELDLTYGAARAIGMSGTQVVVMEK